MSQYDIVHDFRGVMDETTCSDIAAAILVLAAAIERSAPFNQRNAENFGHEFGLALNQALKSDINLSGSIETRVSKAEDAE